MSNTLGEHTDSSSSASSTAIRSKTIGDIEDGIVGNSNNNNSSSSSGNSSGSSGIIGTRRSNQQITKGHPTLMDSATRTQRLGSALFFSISSLLVIFMNKAILTSYHFPHFNFLATIQFLTTFVVLLILWFLRKIDIPKPSLQIMKDILPISCMFLGNIISGLGGTRNLSLPMFTALRRFSILMTMIAEWYVLSSKPTNEMVVAVALMVGGSSIAAMFDFSFDMTGYLLVFLNNIFTALNGVYMKKALSSDCLKKNNLAILFYNSVFSALLMCIFFAFEAAYTYSAGTSTGIGMDNIRITATTTTATGTSIGTGANRMLVESNVVGIPKSESFLSFFHNSQISNGNGNSNGKNEQLSTIEIIFSFEGWSDPMFTTLFIIGALLGSVLNYSIFLCTQYNSALTTAVIGCLKNVATSYMGMLFFNDFTFNWMNFFGINISIMGSLYFTYYELYLRKK